MTVEIQKEADNTLVASISGRLTGQDLNDIQKASASIVQSAGHVQLLVLLTGFEGFAKSDAWGDVSFLEDVADKQMKTAFVGDAKWRDDFFMFTGKGLRDMDIEFFETDQESAAREWLAK